VDIVVLGGMKNDEHGEDPPIVSKSISKGRFLFWTNVILDSFMIGIMMEWVMLHSPSCTVCYSGRWCANELFEGWIFFGWMVQSRFHGRKKGAKRWRKKGDTWKSGRDDDVTSFLGKLRLELVRNSWT
jgi:hypothetical protein